MSLLLCKDTDAQECTAAPGGDWWWIQYAIWATVGFMAILILFIAMQFIR